MVKMSVQNKLKFPLETHQRFSINMSNGLNRKYKQRKTPQFEINGIYYPRTNLLVHLNDGREKKHQLIEEEKCNTHITTVCQPNSNIETEYLQNMMQNDTSSTILPSGDELGFHPAQIDENTHRDLENEYKTWIISKVEMILYSPSKFEMLVHNKHDWNPLNRN